ncbi:MAG: PQQ-binding-like beta-propeller repeat protein [Pontiellaceae bacterium]|nr:PQQ-binding-like beta-propeller repeat protein [Pontiellaceae bacterium]
MKRSIIILAGTVWISAVFGDAWPTYHGGPDLQGSVDTTVPDKPERVWSCNTSGSIENTPVSDGERIFVSPGKGRIVAVSLKGEKVWEKTFVRTNDAGDETPFRFDGPFLCHQGLLLAGSSRGILLALDAATGDEKWRLDIDGILLGSPNAVDEKHVVVLDQGSGALHCIDIETGKLAWTTEGVERCDGSPGIGNGFAVFGSCLAALHVYNATDGKHLRNIEMGDDGQIAGGVAMDGNQAFFGTLDGRLICANLNEGTMVWTSKESDDQTFSTPAVGKDSVVYTSDNGFVYAVDRTLGRTQWKYDTGGYPTSPVIAGDKVVLAADGALIVLKLEDGALLSKQSISDEITSPAIVGDLVIVGADDGTISAWGTPVVSKEE